MFNRSKKSANLFIMLLCLYALFLIAQLALFLIHNQVTELVDSLVNHSLAHQLLNSVIMLPLLQMLSIQLLSYFLLVIWVWFVARSVGELLHLNYQMTYGLGLVLFLLVSGEILFLNNHFYPDSFFSLLLQSHFYGWIQPLFSITHFVLISFSVMAFINLLIHQTCRLMGLSFVMLFLIILMARWIDTTFFTHSPPFTSKKPNIIMIGLDSLRPDFTHWLGNQPVSTPHIDAFLKTATTFTNAYTPPARTFPAWMTILTGKYPLHHHARNNLPDLKNPLEDESLAKVLQANGYETIYATDEKRFSNITEAFGFDKVIGPAMGVDDFILGGLSDFPLTNLLIKLPFAHYLFPYNYANRAANITYQPQDFLHLVEHDLKNHSPNKPLFLAIHFCLAHWPFVWADSHAAGKILPEKYALSVEAVDKQLGVFLSFIKRMGLLDNSLVVLLSDHGTTLGLLGDRLIDVNNYQGKRDNLNLITQYKRSDVSSASLDFKNDYTLNTSYGQGTDVLSLKQYRVLLAFKTYGKRLNPRIISERHSLMDIAPTLIHLLQLKVNNAFDGEDLSDFFESQTSSHPPKPFFIETADTIGQIETDKIAVPEVIKERLGVYRIDPHTGFLYLNNEAEKAIIKNKQRAILFDHWLLARYPAQSRLRLVAGTGENNQQLFPETYQTAPYYVLANLETGDWTLDLKSSFAQSAPLNQLQKLLHDFYGNEIE